MFPAIHLQRLARPLCWLAASLLIFTSTARAGVVLRGERVPASSQRRTPLQGPRLIGAIPDDAALLQVTAFQGEMVHGVVWRRARGARLPVRLHPRALVGLTWSRNLCDADDHCQSVWYRIAATTRDASSPATPASAGEGHAWLYTVEHTTAAEPTPGDWTGMCDAGRPGRFVAGHRDARGAWQSRGYTFVCPDGALASAVRDRKAM